MKVFVIFLAILIINISFLVYQGDLGRYLRMQTTVKAMAEESCAGAALFYDEAAFGDGYLKADPEEAMKLVAFTMAGFARSSGETADWDLDYDVLFFDDTMRCRKFVNGSESTGFSFTYPCRYIDTNGKEIIIDSPSVVITVSISAENIFRLPFLRTGRIDRSAMYEMRSKGI